jgi:hypothetical protein
VNPARAGGRRTDFHRQTVGSARIAQCCCIEFERRPDRRTLMIVRVALDRSAG